MGLWPVIVQNGGCTLRAGPAGFSWYSVRNKSSRDCTALPISHCEALTVGLGSGAERRRWPHVDPLSGSLRVSVQTTTEDSVPPGWSWYAGTPWWLGHDEQSLLLGGIPYESMKKQQKQQQKKQKNTAPQPAQRLAGQTNIGAAIGVPTFQGGMSDVKGHKMAWLAGFVAVGDGTFGTQDGVYFKDNAQTGIVVPTVPVAPADTYVGKTYCSDIIKHYSRVRFTRLRIFLVHQHPATTNDMVAYVAPIRGSGNVVESARSTTPSTPTVNTIANVGAMDRRITASSFQSAWADWTDFIAGGSGPKQNEFSVSNLAANASVIGQDGLGVIPACFAVAGVNGTSTLRGSTTHAIWMEVVMDLLDFIGGITVSYPIGFFKEEAARMAKCVTTPCAGTSVTLRADHASQDRSAVPLFTIVRVPPRVDSLIVGCEPEPMGQFLRLVRKYEIRDSDQPATVRMSTEDGGQWNRLLHECVVLTDE